MRRRAMLRAGAAFPLLAPMARRCLAAAPTVAYPPVVPGRPLAFPRDHGAHSDYRIEWWYVTGWLDPRGTGAPAPMGFQVTFFRIRTAHANDNPSRFAPRQLIIAHAAIADARVGRLRHDQRIARAGLGLAEAGEATTDVRLGDWELALVGNRYTANIPAREFELRLSMVADAPPLLQGEGGFSRKGPNPRQASWYYSRPHLAVSGQVRSGSGTLQIDGRGWLDHEWSSEIMDAQAVGWDWLGVNLDDGALMAFRMRGRDGSVRWAAATRSRGGRVQHLPPEAVRFTARRHWRSPRTGADYPVALDLHCGDEWWTIEPLMDDQELDSRTTTGAVYWEGAVRVGRGGGESGRGYLELTGYVAPMRL